MNSIEFLISNALIDSNISHDKFLLINNVLEEFYDMKEEIKNPMLNKSVNYMHYIVLYTLLSGLKMEEEYFYQNVKKIGIS